MEEQSNLEALLKVGIYTLLVIAIQIRDKKTGEPSGEEIIEARKLLMRYYEM
jgi:hypothetical protein